MVVGAVALIATGIGAAAAVGAFGTVAAGTATAATLATISTIATVASVASAALAIGAALTAKRPGLTGSQTTFNSDPSAGIPYWMGRTANAGNIVYWDTNDTADKGDNDRQTFVAILSGGGPMHGFEKFECDQVPVEFDEGGATYGTYHDFMWQKTQLGLCPEPAALSIPADPITPPGWTAAHKLSGYAAAMWRLRFDTKGKRYNNGTPKPRWIGKGVLVYDPRQDSTFPGGSGPCRALDESTYVYDGIDEDHPAGENPFLHGLTWLLGRWQNGTRILGIGALLAMIDVPAFAEGANVADLNGWKIGGVAYSTDSKWETLVSILQAGCGEPLALGAKISCFVNAPKVSLDTITVGELSGAVRVQATQARRDRINGIIPRYRSEAHAWEVVSAAPVRVPEHVTFDGGERTKEADYVFVQDVKQAATLARYGIENSREFGPIDLPLRPRWIGYKPGDAVTVTVPEAGLNGQKILFTNRDIDPATGCPRFAARSETDAKHPFALGQTTNAPPTPGVTGPPVNPVPGPGVWILAAGSVTDGTTTLPALVIDGSIDSTSSDAIVFEYREWFDGIADDADWIAAGIETPETTQKIIPGVLPATAYQAAVSYRRQGVIGDRLVLGPITTPLLELAELSAIADDGILSRGEKPRVVQDYTTLLAEQGGIDARADAQGITTQKATYDSAISTLTSYLTGLSPAYTDYTADTAIDRSTFITRFRNVYIARQALLNQIAKVAYDQAVAAIAAAQNAQDTADEKINTFYQNNPPSGAGEAEGDLWFDTNDTNKLYTYRSGNWVLTADTRVALAITNAAGAQATADGKVTTYYTNSTPTASAVGDLWYSSTANLLRRWNGSVWVQVATIGADWSTNLSNIPTAIGDGRVAAGLNADGTIKADRVTSLSVTSGSLAVRAGVQLGGTTAGTGSRVSVMDVTVTVTQPVKVLVQFFGAQNYSGSPTAIPDWDCAISVNGGTDFIGSSGGAGVYQSVVNACNYYELAIGTYTFRARWRGGSSNVSLSQGVLTVDAAQRAG
jgi:hypothetical protein